MASDTTVNDLLRSGGWFLSIEASQDARSAPTAIAEQDGDRAVPVAIGDSPGVVIWEDPRDVEGLRPRRVIWSIGNQLYTLIGNYPAATLVDVAKTTTC